MGSVDLLGGDSEAELLRVGARVGELLRERALSVGVHENDAARAQSIATRAVPLLLWKMRVGEVFATGEAAVAQLTLRGFGVAVSACHREDVPWALRRALLPVLRPDAHETWVKWWDDNALPNWAGDFLKAQMWAELADVERSTPATPGARADAT